MNELHIGLNTNIVPSGMGFLFIHDDVPKAPRSRIFDPTRDHFNPLAGMTYKTARQLSDVIYAIYPQGENTLTVRNGKRALLRAFLQSKTLDKINTRGLDKVETIEVEGIITDLLASPVLNKVFCKAHKTDTSFSFTTTSNIYARINRAELGDYDALVLGLFLIGHYKGQLFIPDGGFYLRDGHTNLVRENRLIAGVRFLDELPLRIRNAALLMSDRIPASVLYNDADTLARYAGLKPDNLREDNEYSRYVLTAMA